MTEEQYFNGIIRINRQNFSVKATIYTFTVYNTIFYDDDVVVSKCITENKRKKYVR